MTLYTRHQLALLLVLLTAAGVGLAVGQWRRAYPDLAATVEDFDRDPAFAPPLPVPEPDRGGRTTGAGPRHGVARIREPDAAPVDLNRASAPELARIPGVGPALARRIVAAREADGPFAAVDDLRRVRGVSPGRLERLRPLVTLGE